jgi:hypothetical protein
MPEKSMVSALPRVPSETLVGDDGIEPPTAPV